MSFFIYLFFLFVRTFKFIHTNVQLQALFASATGARCEQVFEAATKGLPRGKHQSSVCALLWEEGSSFCVCECVRNTKTAACVCLCVCFARKLPV